MDDRGARDGSANGAPAGQGGISVPDFLPPAQRVLFMRIQQKQQEEEERARRMAEGGAEKSKDVEGIFKSISSPQGNCDHTSGCSGIDW